ncbi:hypothetical protein ATG_03380 [Desulfurococcaceae archaeon AG1]|nr:MAG: hypothetical protein DJ555_01540 [Desulfurococcaceae archaeon]GAY25135.1 hypothetical protein ATG_03380 [Desulfurococcaceae archaeon AG1]
MIAIVLTKDRMISSPVEAEEFYVVDLYERRIVSGPHKLRTRGSGLSKLGEIITKMPIYSANGIIVSRIGSEGMELAKSSGTRVFRAKGRLEDLVEEGTVGIVEITQENIDPGCPCCSFKHR